MCGIYGATGRVETSWFEAMGRVLAHRGPNEEGAFLDDGVGLGIRRLSIVDPEGGQQPVSNEDGTVTVVFNGEIYNHSALRQALEQKGHRFRTRTDTEVIAHAYEEEGPDCCHSFDGMFAFALWDKARKQLLLARDRVGEKPLFYCQVGSQLLFASEIKAILQHPHVRRQLNRDALVNYLSRLYVPGEETMFEGIRRLEPGHRLLWKQGTLHTDPYWQLTFAPKDRRPEGVLAQELTRHLTDSVKARLAPQGPTGVFLSGGLDSSMILALAQRTGGSMRSYAMGFEAAESGVVDERPFAAQLAQSLQIPHTEVVVTGEMVRDALPKVLFHFDEPFSGAIPQYFLAQRAAADTKVVLSGLGGDELFGNYGRRFKLQRALGYWGWLWNKIPRKMRPESALSQIYAGWFGAFNAEARSRLLQPKTALLLDPSRSLTAILKNYLSRSSAAELGDQVFVMDFKTQLVSEYLAYSDILSMAWGLECRAPFLSHSLVEFAARLPAEMRNRRTQDKYLLRKVCAEVLPPWVLSRKKAGFTLPYAAWLRGPLKEMARDYLSADRLQSQSFFDGQFVQGLLRQFYEENRNDLAYPIWALLCLEVWYEVVFYAGPHHAGTEHRTRRPVPAGSPA